MAEARGATVKFWEIDPKTLRPSLETLKGLLSPKTRLGTRCAKADATAPALGLLSRLRLHGPSVLQ